MNYLYNKMLDGKVIGWTTIKKGDKMDRELPSNVLVLDKKLMFKFEQYVANNYQEFYANKVAYEVLKQGEKFLITLFDNPSITLEEILKEIKE